MASFAQRLRALREERRLSQVELARALHVSNSTISQYETTDRLPEPRILRALADFFGVSVDYLLGRTDVRQPAPVSRVADDELDRAIIALRGQLSPEDRQEIARFIEWVKERRRRAKGPSDHTPQP
jgi:transcriptional regulator with XRE-family HTH domain